MGFIVVQSLNEIARALGRHTLINDAWVLAQTGPLFGVPIRHIDCANKNRRPAKC